MFRFSFCATFALLALSLFSEPIEVGADIFASSRSYQVLLKDQRIGLITNQTAINRDLVSTFDLLRRAGFNITALFAPEHGLWGSGYAEELIDDDTLQEIPIFSLHGQTRRPTEAMLQEIDVLIYDIQDIGSRSYTFISTLFYCMEEAAKKSIPVIVLDRPNPMGGVIVDGPCVQEKWRSFLGYINIPYCHGMTTGELARYFNEEYAIHCKLDVIPMKGWKRSMTFQETGLCWVPTSPHIPEADTPLFYPTTGLIGHLSLVNIGVGYTLPFKVVGAPWIQAEPFADQLNKHNLPGVRFSPIRYKPFFGRYQDEECQGVLIHILDAESFLPIATQYAMLGTLKHLYPKRFTEWMGELRTSKQKRETFHKLNGGKEIYHLLEHERFFIWKIRELCQAERARFLPIRKKYLNPLYD